MNAFFTKAPHATTSPATLSTPKRYWSTLPYDPNSNLAKSGSSSSQTGIVIGIVLIVLFVLVVCVCCYFCHKKKKKQPKNADKNTKSDAGRGRIKTRGRSAEKLGANSKGKQGYSEAEDSDGDSDESPNNSNKKTTLASSTGSSNRSKDSSHRAPSRKNVLKTRVHTDGIVHCSKALDELDESNIDTTSMLVAIPQQTTVSHQATPKKDEQKSKK